MIPSSRCTMPYLCFIHITPFPPLCDITAFGSRSSPRQPFYTAAERPKAEIFALLRSACLSLGAAEECVWRRLLFNMNLILLKNNR